MIELNRKVACQRIRQNDILQVIAAKAKMAFERRVKAE
jgi:hypothetical protein